MRSTQLVKGSRRNMAHSVAASGLMLAQKSQKKKNAHGKKEWRVEMHSMTK